ncbi:formate dehydrogenase subunit delta [Pelomonas sp. KK5]|uniref:formate dehydrogenase subunit delta n=1 Tax=Pelomonas sp. KK5 TaxID=1855730 RepID=UPI00097C1DFD|nr:formate dehydrogenase subunit delta [Pelomonas sp. KK5]
MHIENLIRMANQIGAFFQDMPDHPEALEGASQHIKKFWEPRMRRALLAYVDGDDSSALSPFILEAITTHRELLEPLVRA